MTQIHIPVLLQEAIEYLNLASNKRYIDATLDGGGHAGAVLQKYPGIKILGVEFDPNEISCLEKEKPELARNIILVNETYTAMRDIVSRYSFSPDAILFDLGISLWHLEQSGRGFSFKKNEVLDMRFNTLKQQKTAADIVNTYPKKELERILTLYSQEHFFKEIAYAIVSERSNGPILDTFQLVSVISYAVPEWYRRKKIHCATKTFQAIRIEVNDELNTIRNGIEAAIDVLMPNGRLVVISFHGMEDKVVRQVFRENEKRKIIQWVTKKTIRPSWSEIQRNLRARSAKMKIIEKIK